MVDAEVRGDRFQADPLVNPTVMPTVTEKEINDLVVGNRSRKRKEVANPICLLPSLHILASCKELQRKVLPLNAPQVRPCSPHKVLLVAIPARERKLQRGSISNLHLEGVLADIDHPPRHKVVPVVCFGVGKVLVTFFKVHPPHLPQLDLHCSQEFSNEGPVSFSSCLCGFKLLVHPTQEPLPSNQPNNCGGQCVDNELCQVQQRCCRLVVTHQGWEEVAKQETAAHQNEMCIKKPERHLHGPRTSCSPPQTEPLSPH
mmetsp:Transcript_54998/g.131090  ORF Transcript_54998/g.131090 Transcript_54998/m.131090 type:complete len:258 (-) Transcript_54998:688-1461(-)